MDVKAVLASEILKTKRFLITAPPDLSLRSALAVMKENAICSLPVFSELKPSQGFRWQDLRVGLSCLTDFGVIFSTEGFLGIVSVFDIMTDLAFSSYFREDSSKRSSFSNLYKKLSPENKDLKWQAWGSEENLGSLAGKLTDVHRILVAIQDRAKLLTQTDLIRYIKDNDKENPILRDSVEKVAAKYNWKVASDIIKLNADQTAIEGFRLMKEHRITAVPIINNYERLITTLSSSDARFVTEANIGLITGPALDFLKTCHGIRAPVTAKMTSTIEGVMEQLLESKIHRVWIEEDGKIIGVVSMSNILSLWRS